MCTTAPARRSSRLEGGWVRDRDSTWRRRRPGLALATEGFKSLNIDRTFGALERAECTEFAHDADAAAALLRALVEARPEYPAARFALGRILLAAGGPSGLPHLEHAIERDEEWIPLECQHISNFHARLGNWKEAEIWERRGEVSGRELEEVRAERNVLDRRYALAPHGLSDDAIDALALQFRRCRKSNERGWLGR